jgi:cell division protein FtsN
MKDFAQRVNKKKKKNKSNKAIFKSKNKQNPVFETRIITMLFTASLAVIYLSFYLFDTNLEIFQPSPPSENNVSITFPEKLKDQTVLVEIEEVINKSDCTYVLQVEAYGKENFASEMLYKLTSMNLNPYIEKIDSIDRVLFGVMLGPYKNKSEVNNAREVVIRIGLSPIIKTRCAI